MKIAQHLREMMEDLSMVNDGKFNILLIGERGTGKSALVKKLIQESGENIEKIEAIDLEKKLLENQLVRSLLIDHIEYIPFELQIKISNIISTDEKNQLLYLRTENGDPILCPQLMFTTMRTNAELYLEPQFYKPFIDKISQQFFKFPNLRDLDHQSLMDCWDSVCRNLGFEKDGNFREKIRSYDTMIVSYLKSSMNIFGNFRDLEKLAIVLWRFASKNKFSGFTPSEMEKKLREFKDSNEFQTSESFFRPDVAAEDMIKNFRKSLIAWAEKQYSNLSRQEMIAKLQISEKTYYNWKNEA